MSGAKKTFLLPCTNCAGEIDVVAGQAGGEAQCGSCGTANQVPTFRDLNRLRIKPDATGPRAARWSWQHGMALAGVICAVLAWGTAAVFASLPTSAFDHEELRAGIEAADDETLYRALHNFSAAQVARTMAPQERLLQRKTLFANGVSRVMLVVGAIGAAAAAAAGAMLASRPR